MNRHNHSQKRSRSLATTLAIAFLTLSLGALVIACIPQQIFYVGAIKESIDNQQQLVANKAANTVTSFVQEKSSLVEAIAKLSDPESTIPEEQKAILGNLLGLDPAFRQLVLLDAQAREVVEVSRLSQTASGTLLDRTGDNLFTQVKLGNRYVSPVYVDEVTSEPMTVIAVPVVDVFGGFRGALLAEVNLKFMWDLVDRLEVGETGQAYVVDRYGNLIASGDLSRVLCGENVSQLELIDDFIHNPVHGGEVATKVVQGIDGTSVLGTYVPLGTPDWAVVAELPVAEAIRPGVQSTAISLSVMLLVVLLVALVGIYIARRLAAPLLSLTTTAGRIAGGERDLQAAREGPAEVINLAQAFNSMTAQLRELISSLEQRVAERTAELTQANEVLQAEIAERKQAKEALAEERNLLRTMMDTSPDHIYFKDAESRFIRISKALATWLGLNDPEEAAGKSDFDFFTKEHAQKAYEDEQRIIQTGKPILDIEERETWPDRPDTWVLTSKTPLRDGAGNIVGTFGISRDITERKQSQQALTHERDLLRTLMDAIPDYVYMKDADSRFTNNNIAHCRILGIESPEQAQGKTDFDFFELEFAETTYANEQEIIKLGEPLLNRVEKVKGPNGDIQWVAATKVPLKDEHGRVVGLVGISRDITELKQAEEALKVYASKLEGSNKELEHFIYIASHHLQEPLRKAQTFSDLLQSKYSNVLDEQGNDYIRRIRSAAARMQTLIQALLAYSRVTTKAQPFALVELSGTAHNVVAQLQGHIEQVKGQVEIDDLPAIEADSYQMHQLLKNLIDNALKFHKPDQPPVVRISAQLLNGSEQEVASPDTASLCQLIVADDGIGFDEKYSDRIFQVFQRLHNSGEYEGIGVGLAICRRIVERHNGTITATSGDGQGATFTITLPIEQSEDGNHAYEAINMYGRRS